MRKMLSSMLLATAMMVIMVSTAFAGSWRSNATGWWWQEDNGSWPANEWRWLDGNNDGIAECYHFDANGYMDAGKITADGYQVNADGAWVVNGVVQTKRVGAGNSSASVSGGNASKSDAYSGYAGYEGEKAGYAYVPGLGYVEDLSGGENAGKPAVGGTPEGKENGNKIGYMN